MKKLDSERCPWCGEQMGSGLKDKKIDGRTVYFTDCCNKPFVDGRWFEGELIIVLFLCALIRIFLMPVNGLRMRDVYTVFFPLTLYVLITIENGISKRVIIRDGKRYKAEPEPFLGRARIRWYSARKGGIGFPRLRIINNMIFPVCFVDAKGVPVSQTVCVRLQKRFLYFWRNAGVRLITEDLWNADSNGKMPWEKAEKFVIFNRGEVIGEGKVKKDERIK